MQLDDDGGLYHIISTYSPYLSSLFCSVKSEYFVVTWAYHMQRRGKFDYKMRVMFYQDAQRMHICTQRYRYSILPKGSCLTITVIVLVQISQTANPQPVSSCSVGLTVFTPQVWLEDLLQSYYS